MRAEHVVDPLVVALAHQLTDRVEVAEPLGVELDLGHAVLEVGDHVQPRDALEGLRVDRVGGAVPVVADPEDRARRVRSCGRGTERGSSDERHEQQRLRDVSAPEAQHDAAGS